MRANQYLKTGLFLVVMTRYGARSQPDLLRRHTWLSAEDDEATPSVW